MSEADILRVLRKYSAYQLAEHYHVNFEVFCRLLLKVLDCGVLAAKIFIVMCQYRQDWTCTGLAKETASHRQNVYKALRKLKKMGFVENVPKRKWRLTTA